MLAAALLLLAAADPAPTPTTSAGCRVAVMDLENQGLPSEQAHVPKALTEALAASVASSSGCEVVTRQDIAALIDFEAEKAACGGNVSDSCLSEIGNALGVERMVAGSIARVGAATTVTARLMNLKAGKVEQRAEETTSDDSQLRAVAQNVGKRLFGVAPTPLSTTTTAPPASSGPSVPLLVVGGGVAGVGLAAAVVGGALALSAEDVLKDINAPTSAKDQAKSDGAGAVVVAGIGGAGVVVGLVVAGLAFVLE